MTNGDDDKKIAEWERGDKKVADGKVTGQAETIAEEKMTGQAETIWRR